MKYLIVILFFASQIFSQNFTVEGDSLIGKNINGIKFREVVGNVKIINDSTLITCNKAIQNLENENITLIGNIVVTKDTIRIFTEKAKYFKNLNKIVSDTNILLISNSDSIYAKYGDFNTRNKISEFRDSVNLKTGKLNLLSDKLLFYQNENKIFCTGNVNVVDTSGTIFCDTLISFRNDNVNLSNGNVKIFIEKENTYLFGNSFRDSAGTNSLLTQKPMLLQVNNNEEQADSLFLLADRISLLGDSSKIMIAKTNVKMLNNSILMQADSIYFNVKNDKIQAFKKADENKPVVIWSGENQISGDTVNIYLYEHEIEKIEIIKNSMMIETKDYEKKRFNQISGNKIELYFDSKKINSTKIFDNVLAIYYTEENGELTGLMKASSKDAEIVFMKNEVQKVKLYGEPQSEYHPIELVEGKEVDFILPYFQLYTDKPSKSEFYKRIIK